MLIARQVVLQGLKEDNQSPTVIIMPDSSNVPVNAIISITFSEPVRNLDNTVLNYSNVDSLISIKKNDSAGEPVLFDAVISTDKTLITITPDSLLEGEQTYFVSIGAFLEDYSDNVISEASTIFTTRDNNSPQITFSPATSSTGVFLDTDITITLSEPIRNIDNSEITDSNADTLITFRETDKNGIAVMFDAVINTEKTVITVMPDSDFVPQQVYYIALNGNVEDNSDNAIDTCFTVFTTGTLYPIQDEELQNGIVIYPNPGTGEFILNFNKTVERELVVINSNGVVIRHKKTGPVKEIMINIGEQPAGLYFIQIQSCKARSIQSFKINKQ